MGLVAAGAYGIEVFEVTVPKSYGKRTTGSAISKLERRSAINAVELRGAVAWKIALP
jgi:hypothetical protein